MAPSACASVVISLDLKELCRHHSSRSARHRGAADGSPRATCWHKRPVRDGGAALETAWEGCVVVEGVAWRTVVFLAVHGGGVAVKGLANQPVRRTLPV